MWIIHGQPFGRAAALRARSAETNANSPRRSADQSLVDVERGGQLHGVVGAKPCVFASRMASFTRAGVISMTV